EFGREYIIPKPFDPRVLIWEASAVAQAAMETGVARTPIDLDKYREELERRLGKANEVLRIMVNKARRAPKRVVFPEGESGRILRAAQILMDEKIAQPILLGNRERIRGRAQDLRLHLDDATVIDPTESPRSADYADEFYRLRQRKGVTPTEAAQAVRNPVT